MEFILPILVLLGLGALIFTDDGDSGAEETTGGDTAGDQGSANDLERNFQIFDGLDNTTLGTDGPDQFQLGAGDDTATGGASDDRLFLGAGDDTSAGDTEAEAAGDDLIRGGEGDDTLLDAFGSNTLFGDTGADTLDTNDTDGAADTVFGGFGGDTLAIDDGDTATGGNGEDTFLIAYASTDAPVVITDYTAGEPLKIELPEDLVGQTVSLEAAENGADSNVVVGEQTIAVLQGVTDLSMVNLDVVGTNVLGAADAAGQSLTGTDGDDVIVTASGDDDVSGGAGDDTIITRTGFDRVDGGDGDDVIRTGAGGDRITTGAGADTVFAGFGQDQIDATDDAGTDAADRIFAGARDDFVAADDGDVVNLGAGSDIIEISPRIGDDPVIVRDFDPDADQLVIAVGDDATTTPVTLAPDADGSTIVSIDGTVIAILNNVVPSSVAEGNIALRFPPVDATA